MTKFVVLVSFTVPFTGVAVFHERAFGLSTRLEAQLFSEHFENLLVMQGCAIGYKMEPDVYEVQLITAEDDLKTLAKQLVEDITRQARLRVRQDDSVPA